MILALKTDSFTTEAWLYKTESTEPIAQLSWESGRDLSDQLLSRLIGFLGEQRISLETLTGIIIFSGPGSFTSLRIGHMVANALADSLHIPIVGAIGESWFSTAVASLKTASPGLPALPHYGSDANVTRPKT
jgi:tRNA threonylcarbamoyladenosine biosynthesis protein TsaB